MVLSNVPCRTPDIPAQLYSWTRYIPTTGYSLEFGTLACNGSIYTQFPRHHSALILAGVLPGRVLRQATSDTRRNLGWRPWKQHRTDCELKTLAHPQQSANT